MGDVTITIDEHSGFCFGVVNAIEKAETAIDNDHQLFCLGHIVHNKEEENRLQELGLKTLESNELAQAANSKILFRAHGEPPASYLLAKQQNSEIVDATCPVVLKLQKRIKQAWEQARTDQKQIVIFGKKKHAEVIGLAGQTNFEAIIIETEADIENLDKSKKAEIFSQTTQGIEQYQQIIELIKQKLNTEVISHDTICRQVANRAPRLAEFSERNQVVLFVGGKDSSNAKYLFSVCKKHNPRSFFIITPNDLHPHLFENCQSVGICGATSTPMWLMEQVAEKTENILKVK